MKLSAFESILLKLLETNTGNTVSKEEITRALYPHRAPQSNCIEVFIKRIRRKIGRERIKTKRGVGYMLLPEVQS